MKRAAAVVLALGLWAALPSSAWSQASDGAAPAVVPALSAPSPKDPFERFNRSVYAFNERMDRYALRPIAETYRKNLPEPLRNGVSNFFGNLGDAWSAVNQLLQGKVVQSAQMTLRVATNTVFGLGGLLDPATEFGLERQSEDLGQTLGYWGLPAGPYLVLPVFGPSSVRDALALPVDKTATSASLMMDDSAGVLGASALNLVSTRSELLGASKLLGDIALDPYAFLRDAYLARRRNQVWDGDPPDEPEDEPAR